MRQGIVRFFNNLPIERKLLLTFVIPLIALVLSSVLTYRGVRTFADDEEQLNRVYLTQRTASEYMRLVLELNSGFRGYVMTRQDGFLEPYRLAHDHIVNVGDQLEELLRDHPPQAGIVQEAQRLVKTLMREKDGLIQAARKGHSAEAIHYVEEGRGRAIMLQIREHMTRFDHLEQTALNDALANMSDARTSMTSNILGGIILALVFMMFALHLIARSITAPLVTLAKSVRSKSGFSPPNVAVLDRRDELGELTRVVSAMSEQVRNDFLKLQKSEADLLSLNRDLASSESKYRSLVDHAPFGIFTTNGMAITFSNRYNRILAGLDPNQESDPETFRQQIHPEDRDRVLSEFAQAVTENKPYETIFRFLHHDGTVRKILSRRIPIRDEQNRLIMYQGFNIDITALDQMQTQLSRAERLATLGQVAAGIAHEIRNPLVGIGSTASLLRDDVDPSDPRRADLDVILNETRRLDRIVNQIIDYARPRELAPVVFNVIDIVQEVLKLSDASIAAKGLTVRSALHPMLPALQADRDQMKQVLLNVVQNAVEAMGTEGTLSLSAFESRRAAEQGMVLTVTDTGAGISSQDLAHVFQPFFTTGKSRGTGLGLAICRNIIEAHAGDIQLTSQPGHGTTVRMWLPLRQQPRLTTFS
ncbi:MAG: CHASE3 domain-containing protein [Nitrospirales bacterium]|nr:CHASE3 domain-containing protein [Nitrospirales bacterium]